MSEYEENLVKKAVGFTAEGIDSAAWESLMRFIQGKPRMCIPVKEKDDDRIFAGLIEAVPVMVRQIESERKQLAEAQARNAALERLVREAYEAKYRKFTPQAYFGEGTWSDAQSMAADWRERAAKLLNESEG